MSLAHEFVVGAGLPDVDTIREELDEYRDILLERVPLPVENGIMGLMEVADAIYARAREIEQLIHRAELDGRAPRNGAYYKLRTGELRSFLEMAKSRVELGSRRVTVARLEWEMREAGV